VRAHAAKVCFVVSVAESNVQDAPTRDDARTERDNQ
jgi:hypothetical protein